jgi:hypothetical protein
MTSPATHGGPFRHAEPHAAYQQWVQITGLDHTTPQWSAVRRALDRYRLVEGDQIRQRPEDLADPELNPATSVNSRLVQVSLLAGARYAAAAVSAGQPAPLPRDADVPDPVDRRYPIDPVLGVEIALRFLHEHLPPDFSQQPVADAAAQLTERMATQVCGVFGNAGDALLSEITAARREKRDSAGQVAVWPPLVEAILSEAIVDEVFAEHILVVLPRFGVPVGAVLLPRGHWLVYHPQPESEGTLAS